MLMHLVIMRWRDGLIRGVRGLEFPPDDTPCHILHAAPRRRVQKREVLRLQRAADCGHAGLAGTDGVGEDAEAAVEGDAQVGGCGAGGSFPPVSTPG